MNENFSLKQIDEMSGREMFCVERLRTDVFVTEQKITLPELDNQDLDAVQVFLLNEDQTNALAASRVFKDQKLGWMFGRVAVNKAVRGQDYGKKMMIAIHKFLKEQKATEVTCHAQVSAQGFYEKMGYQVCGPEFDEGGIKHVLMKKKLV